MSSIKRCISAEQPGWLELRMALWPADRAEHLPEMLKLCEQPGRYAQFIASTGPAEAIALVKVAVRTRHAGEMPERRTSPPGSRQASTRFR